MTLESRINVRRVMRARGCCVVNGAHLHLHLHAHTLRHSASAGTRRVVADRVVANTGRRVGCVGWLLPTRSEGQAGDKATDSDKVRQNQRYPSIHSFIARVRVQQRFSQSWKGSK